MQREFQWGQRNNYSYIWSFNYYRIQFSFNVPSRTTRREMSKLFQEENSMSNEKDAKPDYANYPVYPLSIR